MSVRAVGATASPRAVETVRAELQHILGACIRNGTQPTACRLIENALDDLAFTVARPHAIDAERHAIREHATAAINLRFREEQLGVGDIAADVMVSRRQLHVVFADVGMSPYNLILHRRIDEGMRLLRDPARVELTITEIGRISGFNGHAQFSRVISKEAGMSPRAVRNQAVVARQPVSGLRQDERDIAVQLMAISSELTATVGTVREAAVRHYAAAAAANVGAATVYFRGAEMVGTKAVMRCAALKFVDENFRDTHADAATVAEHVGISVRQLHTLLAEDGSTIAGLFRERRTQEGIRLLSDPRYASLGVRDIAERAGFGAVTSFTRAIRAATGHSPSEVRRSALARGLNRAAS
jgi:AraC-like DNA-binding protein